MRTVLLRNINLSLHASYYSISIQYRYNQIFEKVKIVVLQIRYILCFPLLLFQVNSRKLKLSKIMKPIAGQLRVSLARCELHVRHVSWLPIYRMRSLLKPLGLTAHYF